MIGYDHFQVFRVDAVADEVFNLGDVLFGDFEAGTGGHLEIYRELPGIGLGKKARPRKG